MTKRDIRLLLVDDHPLVREGIRSCLATHKHLHIVGEAADGREALAKALHLTPDIVLMDINLPHLNGLEATRLIRQALPLAKVLILTVHNSREYVLQIVQAGAVGYVLKEASPEELTRAIDSAHAGEAFFSPGVAGYVLSDYVANANKFDSLPSLSERERQILGLVVEGYSSKRIARSLGLSQRTVTTHRAHIMGKLNIHTTAGLVKFAVDNQLATFRRS